MPQDSSRLPDRWLTTVEVAAMLHLNRDTVSQWIREGRLPGRRLPGRGGWRVSLRELEAWMTHLPDRTGPQKEPADE